MKKNTSLFNIFSIFTLAAIVLLLVGTASTISMQSSHAQLQGLVNNQTDTSQNLTKTIQISVIEEEESYSEVSNKCKQYSTNPKSNQ
jgi:hypothetical protein